MMIGPGVAASPSLRLCILPLDQRPLFLFPLSCVQSLCRQFVQGGGEQGEGAYGNLRQALRAHDRAHTGTVSMDEW